MSELFDPDRLDEYKQLQWELYRNEPKCRKPKIIKTTSRQAPPFSILIRAEIKSVDVPPDHLLLYVPVRSSRHSSWFGTVSTPVHLLLHQQDGSDLIQPVLANVPIYYSGNIITCHDAAKPLASIELNSELTNLATRPTVELVPTKKSGLEKRDLKLQVVVELNRSTWPSPDVLSQGGIGMKLDDRTTLAVEKMPAYGIVPFGIPDDPAKYEEKEEEHPSLFADLPTLDEDENDDDD